jgi:hypothetical protein
VEKYRKGVIKTDFARRIEKMPVKVTIFSHLFKVEGFVHVIPGSRLLDLLNAPGDFLPVTEATISSLEGAQELGKKDFLALRKSSIILLMESD